jgi:hypothetical protein
LNLTINNEEILTNLSPSIFVITFISFYVDVSGVEAEPLNNVTIKIGKYKSSHFLPFPQ